MRKVTNNMDGYNLIIIYNKDINKVLMCKRVNEPFYGKYNFCGGKIEKNEKSEKAAYRELSEESNIQKSDVKLEHLTTLFYHMEEYYIDVYVGILNSNTIEIYGDENPLYWISIYEDFFDSKNFAGYGLIGHLLEESKRNFLKE